MKEIRFSNLVSPSGDFKRLEGLDAIIDSYQKLLSIKRGTYPFDPEIGTEITKYLFDLDDDVTRELVKDEVMETLSKEDRASVLNVDVIPLENQKAAYIRVVSKVNDKKVEINFHLSPESLQFVKYRLLEDV